MEMILLDIVYFSFLLFIIADGNEMLRAIYRNITVDSRYVVGAVSFNDFAVEHAYDVWANSTYDKCYKETDLGFQLHRQEIEHAVANAINKYDIPGMR